MEFRFVLAFLAVYRIAQLITIDDGPADVFVRLRTWTGCYDLGPNGQPKTGLGKLFGCPFCVGVWVSMPLAVWATLPTILRGSWAEWPILAIIMVFALSGAQSFLEIVGGNREK